MEPLLIEWSEDQTICKSKVTSKASLRILEKYPLADKDVESLFDSEEMAGGSPEEIFKLCLQLLNAWKYLLYFQPKPESLIDIFRDKNYPDHVIKGLLDAYQSTAFTSLVESLSASSHSGIPRVASTDWKSTTILTRNGVDSSSREAVLTLTTDQGVRQVQLDGKNLERLYWTVNQVQTSLDSLLER